jgi:hypothetical protein
MLFAKEFDSQLTNNKTLKKNPRSRKFSAVGIFFVLLIFPMIWRLLAKIERSFVYQ